MMLFTIIAPPAMEEELIDWLLMRPDISGFITQSAHGHGSGHQMALAEQVTGRRQQITFMVQIKKQLAETILADLKQCFSGSGLHYWLVPLLDNGSI